MLHSVLAMSPALQIHILWGLVCLPAEVRLSLFVLIACGMSIGNLDSSSRTKVQNVQAACINRPQYNLN